MRRTGAMLAVLGLMACATTGGAGREPARTAVEAMVPAAGAVARVQAAFVDDGLAVESAEGGVVVAQALEGLTKLRYTATVIPAGDSARVVLTAHGIREAAFGLPRAEAQVTSTMGGPAGKAWARLERIAAALAGATP